MKRIIFMGTPLYARDILEQLIKDDDIDVLLVLTQPDRPVGRKKILTPPPVKSLALEHNIKVEQPNSLKDKTIQARLKSLAPDFIIVAAYGQILPKAILDIAPCINLHASLLPAYRGASPVQQALLNDDYFTGVTAMLMEEGLDTGATLAYEYLHIQNSWGLQELMKRLTEVAKDLTPKVIKRFDNIKPLAQIDALATHCKKIRRQDGEVNLNSAEFIISKYRAFEGWPGVFLSNGLKLNKLEMVDKKESYQAGEILTIEGEDIVVGCKKGSLRILQLQPKGKKSMSAKAYCLGRGLKVGDSII